MKSSGNVRKTKTRNRTSTRAFSDALRSTGYTKARVARELGVSPEQVSRWREEAPQYAIAYLEQVERNQEIQVKLARFVEELKD